MDHLQVKAYFRTVDEKLKAFEAAGMPEGENAEEENEGPSFLTFPSARAQRVVALKRARPPY